MILLFNILFLLFSLFIISRFIAYGLYEINNNKNKSGAISYIIFSILSVIFCNIVILITL